MWRKRTRSFSRLFVALPLLVWLGAPAAQSNPFTAVSQANYEYGQAMRFSLQVDSQVALQAVTLFFRAGESANTYTADWRLLPRRQVTLSHALDLQQTFLPPFAPITYWWALEETGGRVHTLERQVLTYADDRYNWRQLSDGGVSVYWTGQDTVLGQLALDVVAETWPRLTAVIPVETIPPFRIYVYPSVNELQEAMRLAGRGWEWVGAQFIPESNTIAVAAGNANTAAFDLRQSIPHELSHLLLAWAAGPSYENAPKWLDEGLATFSESAVNPTYEAILGEATAAGTTIPFHELCQSFPTAGDEIVLAYAQSGSLVRTLQAQYGNQALRDLVVSYADGRGCDAGVRHVLGTSLAELERAWLDTQANQPAIGRFWRENSLWLILLVASFGLTSLLLLNPLKSRGD
ncbi:MAG: peptidase MA family metallohydrolase [Chloroflexota bacterium]